MWGNAQGWFISAVLLGCLMYGMHMLSELGRVSGPSSFGLEQAKLGPVELPTPPTKLVPIGEGPDSKPLYRAAISEYLAEAQKYERFNASRDPREIEKLPALKDLLEAARTPAS